MRSRASRVMRALVLLAVALVGGRIARLSAAWVLGAPRRSPAAQQEVTQRPQQQLQQLPATADESSPRARLLLPALAALMGLDASAPPVNADWGVRITMPFEYPEPDPDPWVRSLQAKSWANEPWTRQRIYLLAVAQRLEIGILNKRYFVHWSPESYKYDVLDDQAFKDAKQAGKLLVDSDMTEPSSNTLVFIYAKPGDQAWVEEKIGVKDTVEIPDADKEVIEQIRTTPFPPKGWVPPKVKRTSDF